MPQDTDQRDPIVLENTNETGVRLDRLFPNLSADNLEAWRQQARDEEYRLEYLRREFEETQGRRP